MHATRKPFAMCKGPGDFPSQQLLTFDVCFTGVPTTGLAGPDRVALDARRVRAQPDGAQLPRARWRQPLPRAQGERAHL